MILNIMPFKTLFYSLSLGLLTMVSVPVLGQDLLAKQAPIDKKIKAVDSVVFQRIIQKEKLLNVSSLYTTWNNNSVHGYADAVLPDSFKVDLRRFVMPTDSRKITSKFGYRPRFRRQHKGLDIKVYVGDTIRAAFDGKVRMAKYEAKGYGNYVVLRHPNGLETIYGHLSKHLVDENTEVKAGDPIGLGGNTGRSFGSHLHFETRILGQAIDPELMFDFPAQDVTNDFFVFYSPKAQRHLHTPDDYSGIGEDEMIDENLATTGGGATNVDVRYYRVNKGEGLYSIAKKVGVNMTDLAKQNGITLKTKLREGQILKY